MSNTFVVHLLHPGDKLPYCWDLDMHRPWTVSADKNNVNCEKCLHEVLWQQVPGFPNYDIDREGHVRNAESGYILHRYLSPRGSLQVKLHNLKTHKTTSRSIPKLLKQVYDIDITSKELIERLTE